VYDFVGSNKKVDLSKAGDDVVYVMKKFKYLESVVLRMVSKR